MSIRGLFAGAGLLVMCAALPARATVLAQWTFETSPPANAGPHAADVGSGNATGLHAGSATYSNPAGNGSAESFSSNVWAIGDYYQFSTSATGYKDITIDWEQTSSNTGPKDFDLQWSTDGSTFTAISSYTSQWNGGGSAVWSSGGYATGYAHSDAGPASMDDEATIYFRMIMTTTAAANNANPVAAAGASRVDDVVISGTEIPEPATLALLAVGGLAMIRRRK